MEKDKPVSEQYNKLLLELESNEMDKNTIRDWVNMILRLGGGLTLLLIGSVFMIDAVISGRPYPDYVIVGGIIMACGLTSFISEIVKQIFVKYFIMKEHLKHDKEETLREAARLGLDPYCGEHRNVKVQTNQPLKPNKPNKNKK